MDGGPEGGPPREGNGNDRSGSGHGDGTRGPGRGNGNDGSGRGNDESGGGSDDDPGSAGDLERIRADPFCDRLGIRFLDLEPGAGRAALTVRPEHCSFDGTLHRGVLFTLADAVAGAAENAAPGRSIGLEAHVSYLDRVEAGETLTATARRSHADDRSTLSTVEVHTDDGDLVARFSGRGYRPE